MDRRGMFFLVAAALAFALIPVADPKHRWAPVAVGIVYVLLSAASWLDYLSRKSLTRPPGDEQGT